MKAVMYGAGNIGRGFIGQLFYKSGYDVCFVDVNEAVIAQLNERGEYPVEILSNEGGSKEIVKGVRCISGNDAEATARAIANADIMATAVGVNILPYIIDNLAKGVKMRLCGDVILPLNIIICENKIGADKYLEQLIKQRLTAAEQKLFDKYIGLVEASIGRMVPVQTEQMQKGDILRVCVEKYDKLPVDKAAFKGDIPAIRNMIPYTPFEFYIERKLFIHNMGHAMTAYLGSLTDCEYIWQAISDPYIELCVLRAMTESGIALCKRHGVEFAQINMHIEDLLRRFSNKKLGDTAARVGGDLNRKLSPADRLVGAFNMCVEQEILPYYICLAIAAAMLFDTKDPAFENPVSILNDICKIKAGQWHNYIIKLYERLKEGEKVSSLVEYIKRQMSEVI